MIRKRTSAVLLGSAILALANGNAAAQGSERRAALEEVIVTAQRQQQRSQDVPITITTLTSAQMEAQGISSSFDLTKVVPGLVFSRSSSYAVPYLRGVGTTNTSPGDEPSVATYIDGVYYGNPVVLALPYGTVAGMEVLKGPQGTLFGRNATGGVINVTLRGPEFTSSGVASIGFDDYRGVDGNLFMTGPLGERVAASVDIQVRNQDKGYFTNDENGHDVGVNRYASIRQKLQFRVSDDLTIDTSLDYQRSKSTMGVYFGNYPGNIPLSALAGGEYPTRPLHTNSNVDGFFELDSWGGSVTVTGALGDHTIKSITSYRNTDYHFKQQVGFLPDGLMSITQPNPDPSQPDGQLRDPNGNIVGDRVVAPATTYYDNTSGTPYFATQEFQFISDNNGSLEWLAGTYFQFSKDHWDPLEIDFESNPTGGVNFVRYHASTSTRAYAAFAQATWHVTDRLELVGGLRQSYEIKTSKGRQELFGTEVARNRQEAEFDGLSYRFGANYKPTDTAMLYASVSRGFKSGLFSVASFGGEPIDPETLDAYEVGFKVEPSDILRINGSAYYYDYEDIQVNIVTDQGLTSLANAAAAEMKGVELQVEMMPLPGLTLSLSGAYQDTEYRSYRDAVVYAPSSSAGNYQLAIDASGNRTPRAPEFSGTASINYLLHLGDNSINLGLSYYHSDDFYWTADNTVEQEAYGVLDLSAEWRSAGEKYSVLLYGNNVTDEEYGTGLLSSVQGDLLQFGTPAVYGVRFRVNF